MTKELSVSNNLFEGLYIFKNVLFSFLTNVILLFIGAVAMTYFSGSETAIDTVVYLFTAFSVLWGGFRASRHTGRQGLLSGAVSGMVYMALLYFIGMAVLGEFACSLNTLLFALAGIGCGVVGGILGVNFRKRRTKRR